MDNKDLYLCQMPKSRLSDYCIGMFDSSVFVDFNVNDQEEIYLKRISFDGYGCCEPKGKTISMNRKDSQIFIKIVANNFNKQDELKVIIKRTLSANRDLLWVDALEKYKLINLTSK